MQNIATTVAAKTLVVVVAAAMIFSAFVTPAKAATAEELQKMINDLMAQMAALGGTPATTGGSSASVCPFTWTRDLKTGATGADVMTLQKFLNSNADTRVAATGAGSAGMETQTFGPATAAAVSKFQVMHRADILTPAGLTNPTGFFGPSTRAKANALCVASSTGGSTGGNTGGSTGSADLSGEADLDEMTIDSADDDEVEEGSEDTPIAETTFKFRDGDASISRMDVSVTGVKDAWKVLDTLQLWVDGKMVAEEDASNRGDYTDEDNGTIRFSGLDIVGMEDEDLDITIGATFQEVDNADLGNYTVSVDSVRYFDADGVATTEEDPTFELGDTVSFSLIAAGADDEIIVKTSANDPDATTLKLEDNKKSDWYHVFSFDLDTKDSTNDITLNDVVATVNLSSSTYANIVDDVELVIDGTTIDDVSFSGETTGTTTLTFNVDGDVTIDAGDRVEAKLMLRFKSLAAGNEGISVRGSVTGANADAIDAEGTDDLGTSQLSGAAQGDEHTLRTTGVDVALDKASSVVTTPDGDTNDYATYEINLDVTAFEQDVYISTNPATSTTWSLSDGAGTAAVAGSRNVILTSTGDEVGGYFEIKEGETETITVKVTYTPGVANTSARLVLGSLKFNDTTNAPDQTWTALPATTYRTSVVNLVN